MKLINHHDDLHYSNVYIVPQYSEVISRKTVNTSVKLGNLTIDVPVISANMDTVTESEMCIAMAQGGGIGALHRFMSVEKNVNEYNVVRNSGYDCFVSIGVNSESMQRAESLYNVGARYFIIDIAHGNSLQMKNMIEWLRKGNLSDVFIMAGNVATFDGVLNLKKWGANCAKVGIGPGSVCLTKNVTGVTVPQFTAVYDCVSAGNQIGMPIIADGGATEYGDICKAIGVGATMVMSGKFFAGCTEAPGERKNGMKVLRGMASKEAMSTIKREEDMATPEGKSMFVPEIGSAQYVLRDIKGSLQSSMSYSNAVDIQSFQSNVILKVRKKNDI